MKIPKLYKNEDFTLKSADNLDSSCPSFVHIFKPPFRTEIFSWPKYLKTQKYTNFESKGLIRV